MDEPRTTTLFRHGEEQAVSIPSDFELPGSEVTIRRQGDALIIEPKPAKRKPTLLEVLDQMVPLTKEEWPDIDDSDLPPLDDIEL
jgi:antitoxin VapB